MADEDAMLMYQRLQENTIDYKDRRSSSGGPATVGDDFDGKGILDFVEPVTEDEKAKARAALAVHADNASNFLEACQMLDILPEGFELK